MPPKRKASDAENTAGNPNISGSQRKKQKINAAREIKVQFNLGRSIPKSSESKLSGTYLWLTIHIGMDGLPSTLDVEKFTKVRVAVCSLRNPV